MEPKKTLLTVYFGVVSSIVMLLQMSICKCLYMRKITEKEVIDPFLGFGWFHCSILANVNLQIVIHAKRTKKEDIDPLLGFGWFHCSVIANINLHIDLREKNQKRGY